MKLQKINLCKYALAIALAGGVGNAWADQKVEALRSALSKITAAEMPVKAAEIVSKTKAEDRASVAGEVVKLVVKSHPTMSVATVGLISSKCPENASIVAATAAKLQPKQATLLAKAAAASAPAQAGAIVRAVCKVVSNHPEVALAVAEAAPSATMDILEALEEAMPNLKARIAAAIASFDGNVPSVAAVFYRVNNGNLGNLAGNSGTAQIGSGLRGPTVQPPYNPLPPLVTPPTTPTAGILPVGSVRDYAAP